MKAEVARRAGADHIIDYIATPDFAGEVRRLTNGRGADVIYDPVGGNVFDKSLSCLAWNGRIVVVGFTSGTIPSVRINRILLKNIEVTGLHYGQYVVHQPEVVPQIYKELFRLYEEGWLSPIIYGRYTLEEIPKALEELSLRKTYGKLVVLPQEVAKSKL